MMGFEPTTFCMASHSAGNDVGQRLMCEASFLHGFRGLLNFTTRFLHEHVLERFGQVWATGPVGNRSPDACVYT
jgi:hypothetical protein